MTDRPLLVAYYVVQESDGGQEDASALCNGSTKSLDSSVSQHWESLPSRSSLHQCDPILSCDLSLVAC